MERIYLIQTGTFKYSENIDGIDSILSFHYMGAAEFEQCLVKENGSYVSMNPMYISLMRILKNRTDYIFSEIENVENAKHESMFVFCKNEELADTMIGIRKLIQNDRSCKCGIKLSSYIQRTADELDNPCITNFWWDIQNDFFFFFGTDKIDMINKAFDHMNEKYKDELTPKTKKPIFERILRIFANHKSRGN